MHRRGFFFFVLPGVLSAAPRIAGRWRSVNTTKGGIGAVYNFESNGSATYSSVALIETTFQQNGDYLTLGGQTAGVGWHQDGRLQLNFGNDQVEDYTRRGTANGGAKSLLGEWAGSRMMEGRRLPVSLHFYDGNRALLVIYLKTVKGSYRPQALPERGWTLTLPSLPARTVAYDSANDQLTIAAAGGDPHRFVAF